MTDTTAQGAGPATRAHHAGELVGAGHEGGVGDALVGRAEDRADQLLQDQAQAPGGEQGLERAAIEVAGSETAIDRSNSPGGS